MTLKMKKQAAVVVALVGAWALSGATASAQISPGFSNTVQQNLETQRQAANAANGSASSTDGAAKEKGVLPLPAKAKWDAVESVEALFIAAQGYENLTPLNGCANDARLLQSWFNDAYSDKKGALTILSDDAELSETTPSRKNIEDALKEKVAKDCDCLIVTFAGHGVNRAGKSFLCPIDVKGTNLGDVDSENRDAVIAKGEENNLIAVEKVLELLKGAKAKNVVVIFDACRDLDSDSENNFTREFVNMIGSDAGFTRQNGGFFVLTSCSTGEEAHETTFGGKKYGLFTYYFVEGLKGKADFSECCDGFVTLNEAYNYAQSKVRKQQSPEFFMATKQLANLPTMTRVELDGLTGVADLAELEKESNAEFLLRAGYVLSQADLQKEPLRAGEKALTAALKNSPNNGTAFELRGSVRRSLGEYEGALADLKRAGAKLQFYVKSKHKEVNGYPEGVHPPIYQDEWTTLKIINDQSKETGGTADTFDLLTVDKIDNGHVWVTEKNNAPLGDQAGWVKLEDLTWDFTIPENIVNATDKQRARYAGREVSRASVDNMGAGGRGNARASWGGTPRPSPVGPAY